MKLGELRYGNRYWDSNKNRYLFYNGKAYNSYDYEFVDNEDNMVYLNAEEIFYEIEKC